MFPKTLVPRFIFWPWLISCKILARILQVLNHLARFLQDLNPLITRVVCSCQKLHWSVFFLNKFIVCFYSGFFLSITMIKQLSVYSIFCTTLVGLEHFVLNLSQHWMSAYNTLLHLPHFILHQMPAISNHIPSHAYSPHTPWHGRHIQIIPQAPYSHHTTSFMYICHTTPQAFPFYISPLNAHTILQSHHNIPTTCYITTLNFSPKTHICSVTLKVKYTPVRCPGRSRMHQLSEPGDREQTFNLTQKSENISLFKEISLEVCERFLLNCYRFEIKSIFQRI